MPESTVHKKIFLTMIGSILLLLSCTNPSIRSQSADKFSIANSERNILVTVAQGDHYERSLLNSFGSINYQRGRYPALSLSVRRNLNAIASDYQLTEIKGWSIKSLNVYCVVMAVPDKHSLSRIIQQLQEDKRVESAQRLIDYTVQALPQKPLTQYNDPYYSLQFQHQGSFIGDLHQWSTGRGIDIAIVDTGVDRHHPDLHQQITVTRNFVDTDEEQFNEDIHGTALAGIIAARANNNLGIVGLAPDAKLWVLKACWQLEQQSSRARCNSFTLASALSFAVDNNVDIINISLAGPFDPLIARLVSAALEQGIIVIAADPVVTNERFPANMKGVVAVREKMYLTAGAKSSEANHLIVTVNGREILSTGPGGGYDFFSGSSMSAAMVSAYAALLHEKKPALSSSQLVLFLNRAVDVNSVDADLNVNNGDRLQSLLLLLK